jgi:hypothetical protein
MTENCSPKNKHITIMENKIQQFTHANGYALRTVVQDGTIYFVGKGQQYFINIFLKKSA